MDSRFAFLKENKEISYHRPLNTFKAAFPGREDLIKLLYLCRFYPDSSWQKWIDGEGGILSIKDKVVSIQYDSQQYQFTSDILKKSSINDINDLAERTVEVDDYLLFFGIDQRLRIFKDQQRINPCQLKLEHLLKFANY